jgi:hypothetical protein
MCQGEVTPEETLLECRNKTPTGKRNVPVDLVNGSSMCLEVLVTGMPAGTPVTFPAVLLQLVILQEASMVLSVWKLARGEGEMSEQLMSGMGDALAERDESTYVYGDMITFTKMLKDSAVVRMVAQRVTDACVVRGLSFPCTCVLIAVVSLFPVPGLYPEFSLRHRQVCAFLGNCVQPRGNRSNSEVVLSALLTQCTCLRSRRLRNAESAGKKEHWTSCASIIWSLASASGRPHRRRRTPASGPC